MNAKRRIKINRIYAKYDEFLFKGQNTSAASSGARGNEGGKKNNGQELP